MNIRLAFALFLSATPALADGFQFVEIPAAGTEPAIEAAVWYPTDAPFPEAPNTPFGQALSHGAPVAGEDLPLVVISHGDGGWFGGHAELARELARAGMVAVAPNHPGNSEGDETASPERWITERPRHLSRVVDYMTDDWAQSDRLDEARVGAFGFSAGGQSVFAAAGAQVSLQRIAAYCADTPEEFTCRSGMAAAIVEGAGEFPAPVEGLRVVVAAAPSFGFSFDPRQIAELGAVLQIWGATEDQRVSYQGNVAPFDATLTAPSETRRVANAGHFAFRPPCDPALEEANPRIWALACVDPDEFDRAAFQHRFNAAVVAFLSAHLTYGR
jgi:predicted dienelactone hydrolase